MEELSQKVRTAIEQAKKVMNDGIEILFVGMENHRLREELRKLGYQEAARRALYDYVDLDKDGEPERYVLFEGRLYSYHKGLMEDTGITREIDGDGFGVTTVYLKDGKVIKQYRRNYLISPGSTW